jgi:uncharacterized protein (DUF1778 family)
MPAGSKIDLSRYEGLPTKAAKIRALLDEGHSRTDIAKALGIRYQHVRNVDVNRPAKNASNESRRVSESTIEIEVPSAVKEIIEHAAKISGRGVSEIVIAGALEAANATIERIGRLALSARDSETFAKALLDPPEPNDDLKSILKR